MGIMDWAVGAMNVADTLSGASTIRDLIGGQGMAGSFDQFLAPWRSDNRLTGKQALRDGGWIGPDDTAGTDLAGLALEFVDPLALLTGVGITRGALSALARSKAASKLATPFAKLGRGSYSAMNAAADAMADEFKVLDRLNRLRKGVRSRVPDVSGAADKMGRRFFPERVPKYPGAQFGSRPATRWPVYDDKAEEVFKTTGAYPDSAQVVGYKTVNPTGKVRKKLRKADIDAAREADFGEFYPFKSIPKAIRPYLGDFPFQLARGQLRPRYGDLGVYGLGRMMLMPSGAAPEEEVPVEPEYTYEDLLREYERQLMR